MESEGRVLEGSLFLLRKFLDFFVDKNGAFWQWWIQDSMRREPNIGHRPPSWIWPEVDCYNSVASETHSSPACQISTQSANWRLSCWWFNKFSQPVFRRWRQFCTTISQHFGSDLHQLWGRDRTIFGASYTPFYVEHTGKVQLVAREHSQRVIRVTADGGRVDDSKPHTIILRADSTHGTIQLDDGQQCSFTSPAVGITASSVHLGSLSHSSATLHRYLSPLGFVGCIQVSWMYSYCCGSKQ